MLLAAVSLAAPAAVAGEGGSVDGQIGAALSLRTGSGPDRSALKLDSSIAFHGALDCDGPLCTAAEAVGAFLTTDFDPPGVVRAAVTLLEAVDPTAGSVTLSDVSSRLGDVVLVDLLPAMAAAALVL